VDERIGDVTDPSAVQSAMQGVDAVVHLAALLHIVNPPPALREKYEQVNVGGTATVVEAATKDVSACGRDGVTEWRSGDGDVSACGCDGVTEWGDGDVSGCGRRGGVKRIVLASTIAVYGPSNGKILNEGSPVQPDTFYAQTKLAAEKIVLNARNADGQPIGTVLRFGAVYGARIKGNYARLLRALARHRFIPIGAGANRRTLVYDKDVAGAVVLAVRHPAAAGNIYNVTDGCFHTLNEIIMAISTALGRTPPRFAIPVAPVRFMAGIAEDVMRLTGRRSPINRATIDKYTEDIAVEGQRIQKELGFVPRYDLAAGWRETVGGDDVTE